MATLEGRRQVTQEVREQRRLRKQLDRRLDKHIIWAGRKTIPDSNQLSRTLASIDPQFEGLDYADRLQSRAETFLREIRSLRYLGATTKMYDKVDAMAYEFREALIRFASPDVCPQQHQPAKVALDATEQSGDTDLSTVKEEEI